MKGAIRLPKIPGDVFWKSTKRWLAYNKEARKD